MPSLYESQRRKCCLGLGYDMNGVTARQIFAQELIWKPSNRHSGLCWVLLLHEGMKETHSFLQGHFMIMGPLSNFLREYGWTRCEINGMNTEYYTRQVTLVFQVKEKRWQLNWKWNFPQTFECVTTRMRLTWAALRYGSCLVNGRLFTLCYILKHSYDGII